MKPSSFSTIATAVFTFESGTSTRSVRFAFALRMRVRRSATGSVMVMALPIPLPGGLAHAGDLAAKRELAEAVAVDRARAPADAAAQVSPDLVLGLPETLQDDRLLGHVGILGFVGGAAVGF